jgi:hypothetical protein
MGDDLDPREALDPSGFIDSDHPDVRDFTESVVRGVQDPRQRVGLLFREVRDRLRYDPYSVAAEPPAYRASAILDSGPTWCVPKAVLLTATLRAAGVPALLGFSDVRNHLNSEALLELMGTDLFVFHGWTAAFIDGRWRKGSPAFDSDLCRRFGVPPLEFDGSQDALLHAADGTGRRHMEYVRERGMFVDLPFDELMATLQDTYGPATVRGSGCSRLVDDPAFGA